MAHVVHVITPGDHYSPLTGSATVTVAHGLSLRRPAGQPRPAVVVARGTYPDRYDSADIVEYDQRMPRRTDRYVDVALARVGMPRVRARGSYARALAGQREWTPSAIVCHNAVQAVPEVDVGRHGAVLYAHNDLLRSYSSRELSRVLAPAQLIVAVSDFLADVISMQLPRGSGPPVEVVRNGVDLEAFTPGVRADGPLEVVYLGRVIPSKGVDVLVDAVTALGRADVRLSVIGSAGFDAGAPLTPYELSLRARASDAGQAVRFLPFQTRQRVVELLSGADVVVVPSRWQEPFALTALEGMAAGAAVIGSDIGGIPETVRQVGMLVPPGDSAALASAVEALASDRASLRAMQERCLAYARTQGWATAAARLYELLDR